MPALGAVKRRGLHGMKRSCLTDNQTVSLLISNGETRPPPTNTQHSTSHNDNKKNISHFRCSLTNGRARAGLVYSHCKDTLECRCHSDVGSRAEGAGARRQSARGMSASDLTDDVPRHAEKEEDDRNHWIDSEESITPHNSQKPEENSSNSAATTYATSDLVEEAVTATPSGENSPHRSATADNASPIKEQPQTASLHATTAATNQNTANTDLNLGPGTSQSSDHPGGSTDALSPVPSDGAGNAAIRDRHDPKFRSYHEQGTKKKVRSVVRSHSERVLSSFGPATLTSLDVAHKKKRSKIKKRLLKIHKVLKTKLVPPLEESEESEEYLAGSDDSEHIEGVDGKPSEGLTNGHATEKPSQVQPTTSENGPFSFRSSSVDVRTASRNSSPIHRSSTSSVELEIASLSDNSKSTLSKSLKHNSSSPAALSRSDVLFQADQDSSEDPNARLTPTLSNFEDSHLISPSMGIAYRPPHTLEIQSDYMSKSPRRSPGFSKHGSMRKKKRSGSWYNVLSPSYKQKNDDFHKFFKDLPLTERLLVDYTCALVKDILVQGRLYVSQNYLCFHSNILKWQTAVTVKLIDIDNMTKEKTVKVIPNAIQFLLKDKPKMTFTSFTARDRAFLMTFKLWQNALLEKPMSARDLWCQIHSNYGEELGLCSSDDDYVKPEYMPRKHQSIGDADGEERYQFGTTNKVKKKKKSSSATQTPPPDGDGERGDKSQRKSSRRHSSHDSSPGFQIGTDNSTADEKSVHSSQCTNDEDASEEEDEMLLDEPFDEEGRKSRGSSQQEAQMAEVEEEEEDGPVDFVEPDCSKVSLSRDYETSAQDMFRIIFGDDCPFWKGTLIKKQSTEIDFGMWTDDDKVEGQRLRDLSYTLKLDNPIGPKTSHCKEKQILSPNTVHGKSYAIDCIVQNYGIPYADYFQTCMRYCIKKVTKDTCHLRITSELRYKKTPWGLIKNFLEKNVAIGLSDNFTKLELQIQQWIDYEKQKGTKDEKSSGKGNVRRRKRKGERGKGDAEGSRNLPNGLIGEGGTRKSLSDLNNNEQRLSASGVIGGDPMLHPPNGFIPNSRVSSESPKLQFFGPGGRLIAGAIVFIFLLLIYSNYSMYQRLTTLEQVTAAAAAAEGVDPSVTAALLDRPGAVFSGSPEILSTYLQAIDKRLRRLEGTMEKFTEDWKSSGERWEKMEHQWSSLMEMMQAVIQQKSADGG